MISSDVDIQHLEICRAGVVFPWFFGEWSPAWTTLGTFTKLPHRIYSRQLAHTWLGSPPVVLFPGFVAPRSEWANEAASGGDLVSQSRPDRPIKGHLFQPGLKGTQKALEKMVFDASSSLSNLLSLLGLWKVYGRCVQGDPKTGFRRGWGGGILAHFVLCSLLDFQNSLLGSSIPLFLKCSPKRRTWHVLGLFPSLWPCVVEG